MKKMIFTKLLFFFLFSVAVFSEDRDLRVCFFEKSYNYYEKFDSTITNIFYIDTLCNYYQVDIHLISRMYRNYFVIPYSIESPKHGRDTIYRESDCYKDTTHRINNNFEWKASSTLIYDKYGYLLRFYNYVCPYQSIKNWNLLYYFENGKLINIYEQSSFLIDEIHGPKFKNIIDLIAKFYYNDAGMINRVEIFNRRRNELKLDKSLNIYYEN